MRIYLLAFVLTISCTMPPQRENSSEILIMQRIWDSKDPGLAYSQLSELKRVEETEKFYVLAISNENNVPRLSITYDKQTNKAVSASLWLFESSKGTADYIKSQIKTSDWKTFEHQTKSHTLRAEVSEYSDSKGISFLYDKLDSKKEVRKLYWGVDPKSINW